MFRVKTIHFYLKIIIKPYSFYPNHPLLFIPSKSASQDMEFTSLFIIVTFEDLTTHNLTDFYFLLDHTLLFETLLLLADIRIFSKRKNHCLRSTTILTMFSLQEKTVCYF